MATGDRTSTVSPPSNSGAVPGLGETFRMNLNTGQGVYSYKIAVPDGVAGFQPALTLEYSHGARFDAFGLGWTLALRAIERRLDLGAPDPGVKETYLDSGSEIVELQDGSFALLNETSFARYTRVNGGWRVEERDGSVHELGSSSASRIEDPKLAGHVQTWLLAKSTDVSGNTIAYKWDVADGFPYPLEIRYAAYSLRFVYEQRPDARLDGRAGFLRKLQKRCVGIELFLDPGAGEKKLKAWSFTYDNAGLNGVSLLKSIQLTSFANSPDLGGDVVRAPLRFSYNGFDPLDYSLRYFDADAGDPPPLTHRDVALVNLDQAPLPGVLETVEGAQYYWRNRGSGWEAPEALGRTPYTGSFATAGVAFMDMNGNGKPDLMLLAPGSTRGYYENAGQKGWGRFVAYPRARRTMPDWASPRLRLADTDGNGRIDAIESGPRGFVVWRNEGEAGWRDPNLVSRAPTPDGPKVDFANTLIRFADMTGDGSEDIVEISSGRVEYWPNLGNGSYGDGIVMQNSPRLRDLERHPDKVFLLDVDGDGCADLVYLNGGSILVAVNRNGSGFANSQSIDTIPAPIPGTMRAANLAGTAAAGLTWNSYRSGGKIGYVSLQFGVSAAPYLLSTIDNNSGLVSQLFYRSAVEDYLRDRKNGVLWDTNFPFPLLVVARTLETDHVTGQVTEILYQYHDAHYEPKGRRFEGFRTAERIEKGDESRPDTRMVHQFLMAMELVPGNTVDHAALNGSLARIDVYGMLLESRPLSTEETEYAVKVLTDASGGRHRTLVTVTTHRTLDIEATTDVRGEEKTYTYDATGNVVREVHRGFGTKDGVVQAEQVRTTDLTYAASANHRLLGKPARVVVRDGSGKIISETRTLYDGADFIGLGLGQADRGLLTRRLRLVWPQADFNAHYDNSMDGATALGFIAGDDADGHASQFVAEERHAYDARGLKIADTDALGLKTQFTFDADGLFRTQLSSPLGTTKFVYDRTIAQPTQIAYPNGEMVRLAYDAQGRVRWSVTPADDAAHPPRQYSYDDTAVPNVRTVRMLQSTAGDVHSNVFTYFDGRGSEVQQRAQVDATTYVVSGWRAFNPWGDLKQEFEPQFSPNPAFSAVTPGGAPSRTIQYDGRGRVVRTRDYNGGISTARYFPFRVELGDANDNDTSPENIARGQANTPRREEFDVFRMRTAVVEILGGGKTMTTTYVNDAMGRTLEIHDGAGVLCSYQCDRLGNRYEVNHRAAGRRRLWYDARNHVVRSLDANGNDLRVTMDILGRLQRLSSAGTILEDYTYDDGGADALGRISSVTSRGGKQSFHYDAAGRMIRGEYSFDGAANAHQIDYAYDTLGREISRKHSDGTTIQTNLTFHGWIKGIPNVLTSITYDPRGLPLTISYVNGVTTTISYFNGPGRVKTQRTTGPHGEVYEDISYGTDQLGILLTSNDIAPAGRGSASYTYDPLYQLTSCTSGVPQTVQTYSYSNFLNLARIDETKSALAFDDAQHPDRIAGVTIGGGARQNLNYDANGNLLGFANKVLAYNEKNELVRIQRADGLVATYAYDPQGRRVSKQVTDNSGTVTTRFVGSEVEIRGGQTFHYVNLGARRVCMLSKGDARFFHTDYAGNTVFFTSPAGAKLASLAWRPFGNIERSDGAIDNRTYGLHPFDTESGLFYMHRRYYSPDLGRFLTPDPLPLYRPHNVLGNPKALHPYAYAGNDPLNNVDYDGLSFWSVVGAIVGVIVAAAVVAAVVALSVATGGLAALAIGAVLALGIVSISYVVAANNTGNGWGEFFRGFMIGFNAGLNAAIGTAIFGPVVGVALGVINFLAAFDGVAGNKIYQGFLGWSSWLMPMSWVVTAIGLGIFLINVIAAGVTWNGNWFGAGGAKIDSISIDWGTGTIVMTGGWIRAPSRGSAFNMGNFAYLKPGSTAEQHETGHTLGIAAFGSIFGLLGSIEQASSSSFTSYSEHLAESHSQNPSDPDSGTWWHMWGTGS